MVQPDDGNLFPGNEIPVVFGGGRLDRAEDRREDPAWLDQRLADPGSRFLLFSKLRPLMFFGGDGSLDLGWLSGDAVAPLREAGASWLFLGLDGDIACFAMEAQEEADAAAFGGKFIDARSVAVQWGHPEVDAGRASLVAQGRALFDWHARHGFCAVCGSVTEMAKAGYARRCADKTCGAEHFPRTDPVVIMLAVRDGKCLVGRQAMWPKGFYSALAGFVEPGETIEEAVRRELHEEAGIAAGEVRYMASQPWPFPSSLMIACFAEALSEDIKLDERELEHAQWVDREGVAKALAGAKDAPFSMPPPMAIARILLEQWVRTGG